MPNDPVTTPRGRGRPKGSRDGATRSLVLRLAAEGMAPGLIAQRLDLTEIYVRRVLRTGGAAPRRQ